MANVQAGSEQGRPVMRKILIGLVVCCAFPALAADHPCKVDADRLCQGIEPGQGRVAKCLKSHEADVSPECKARMSSFKEQASEVKAACKDDVDKFCKDTKPGSGAIAACLKQHEADLSDACRKETGKMAEHKSMMQDVKTACKEDAAKLCPDMKPGEGKISACLKSHSTELSPDCTSAIGHAKTNW
jgi:hypothetical protein